MWLIPNSSLQLHIKKPWKSWAASILLALSSAGNQTARRCWRNPDFSSRTGNLSLVKPKTFNSPLVWKEEVKKTHHFLQLVHGKLNRGLAWHRRGGRKQDPWQQVGFFHHNHTNNLPTDMTLPRRLLGTLEKLVTTDTEKWHKNVQKTKFRYRKHK